MLCIALLILTMLFSGCQNINEQDNLSQPSNTNPESTPNLTDNTITEEPLSSRSIEIQSLEKLSEMRTMAACKDESQLEQYILSIANTGVRSKDDFLSFVNLIDLLPHISILDGEVTWICFSNSISEDTGKETNVVYITTEAPNGDWTRIEYVLSVTDVSVEISNEKSLVGENSILTSPIQNADGNLILHIETRNPHPSGKGTMVQWVGEVDGVFTRIYYYTNNANEVKTDNLFRNIQISDILQCAQQKMIS